MCKSKFHPFLAALPKCEHHVHLEGTLEPELMFTLSKKNGIELPQNDPAFASPSSLLQRYANFTSLDDFLHYYFLGMSVLLQEDDFELLAMAYFQRAKVDGVHHAEVFFDPEAHTSRSVSYESVVAGFSKACKRAEIELGITTKLILCVLRHLPVDSAQNTFDVALKSGNFNDGTLGGLGISSTELNKPPRHWESIFKGAKTAGVNTTAHAGEEGPAEYIAAALDVLQVSRIDHGRRLAEDPALMKRVAEQNVMLTLCPISNLQLRGISKMEDMPIQTFLNAGVNFSLNSDDPAYFGGYILDNYCAVQEAFDLSITEWEIISSNAIQGSWCNSDRKEVLSQMLRDCMGQFNGLAI